MAAKQLVVEDYSEKRSGLGAKGGQRRSWRRRFVERYILLKDGMVVQEIFFKKMC